MVWELCLNETVTRKKNFKSLTTQIHEITEVKGYLYTSFYRLFLKGQLESFT